MNDSTPASETSKTQRACGAEQEVASNTTEWSEVHSHLQDGFRNAQETIRAMDTKVSILTGLSVFAMTAVGGILGSAANCFGEHPEYFRAALLAPNWLLMLAAGMGAAIVVSLVFGVVSILSCVEALRARNRIEGITELPATVLFPHLPTRGKLAKEQWLVKHRLLKEYYDRIAGGGFSGEDIQKEYHDQILNLGIILGEKIAWFRRASSWFWYQVIATGAVLVLLLLTMVGIGIAHRTRLANGGEKGSSVSVSEPTSGSVLRRAP